MEILPTLAEVKKIASAAKYNVLPVSLEILSDFTTPIETMKILKNVSTHCYMLESAQANETWGRYTFLGFDPKMEITCMDGEMKIGNLRVKTDIEHYACRTDTDIYTKCDHGNSIALGSFIIAFISVIIASVIAS